MIEDIKERSSKVSELELQIEQEMKELAERRAKRNDDPFSDDLTYSEFTASK